VLLSLETFLLPGKLLFCHINKRKMRSGPINYSDVLYYLL